MSAERAPDVLVPSVFDRLTDPASKGTGWRPGYSLDQLRERLRADLEDLLDTPRAYPSVPADMEETAESIENYGLPDLASFRTEAPEDKNRLIQEMRATILRFEPRLRDVEVELADPREQPGHILRFRIKAVLNADPAPEMAFNTILELATGRCQVRR